MDEYKKIELIKGKAKYHETVGRPAKLLSIVDNNLIIEKHNTQKIISDKLGWSTGKYAQADIVYKKAPEEVKGKSGWLYAFPLC